jgi:hypothetical protein
LAQNNCYTFGQNSETVVNPQGTLYLTANSATGSKFYELLPQQQNYIAYRNQDWKPSYSVISLDGNTFGVETYNIVDGKAVKIDKTFTIEKTAARTAMSRTATAATQANPETGEDNGLTVTAIVAALALLGLAALGVNELKNKVRAGR